MLIAVSKSLKTENPCNSTSCTDFPFLISIACYPILPHVFVVDVFAFAFFDGALLVGIGLLVGLLVGVCVVVLVVLAVLLSVGADSVEGVMPNIAHGFEA